MGHHLLPVIIGHDLLPVMQRACEDLDDDCLSFNSAEALACWRYDPERGVCPLVD
jgi:hypothetical protein